MVPIKIVTTSQATTKSSNVTSQMTQNTVRIVNSDTHPQADTSPQRNSQALRKLRESVVASPHGTERSAARKSFLAPMSCLSPF